jgi:hypothetical protein
VLRDDAAYFVARKVMTAEAANSYLAKQGLAPIDAQEQTKSELQALRKDPEFLKKFAAFDADAVATAQRLTIASAMAAEEMPPAAKAEDFALPAITDATTKELTQIRETTTAWLTAGEFTKETGNYLAREAATLAPKYEAMTPDERQTFADKQTAMLQKVWGDKTQENIRLAKQLVREIAATPRGAGVVDFLERSGAGNSANVILQLAGHARRLQARRQTR